MFDWVLGRYGWIAVWATVLIVVGATALIDRQWQERADAEELAVTAAAQEDASVIADAIGNAISERIGALAAPRLQFTPVEDSVSRRVFDAAVDSVISRLAGLDALSRVTTEGASLPLMAQSG